MRIRKNNLSPCSATRLRWLFAGLSMIALVSFTCYLWSCYSIKPYSDPLNWLRCAVDLRGTLQSSVLPIGYPLYLWCGLKLLGDVYVFFVNYPLLIIMAGCVGLLVVEAIGDESSSTGRCLGFLLGVCLVFGADPRVLRVMLNPYRDPLAHVFLMGSVVLFMRYMRTQKNRHFSFMGSAILMGLAYATREPSIIMAPVLLCCGLLHTRRDPKLSVGRDVLIYAAGILLGAFPYLLQTWFVSGQVLLPAKAAVYSSPLPGFRPADMDRVAMSGINYFVKRTEWFMLNGVILGLFFILWRRRTKLILLLVVPLLGYALLYFCYWTFVSRYFFVVLLFASALCACGYVWLIDAITARTARRDHANILIAFVAVTWLIMRLHHALPATDQPRVTVFRAAQFRDEVQRQLEPDALVFCERNLSEFIEWFGKVEARPTWLLSSDRQIDVRRVKTAIDEALKEGRKVYAVDRSQDQRPSSTASVILQTYNLSPLQSVFSDLFATQASWWRRDAPHLYEVTPWTNHVVSTDLVISSNAPRIIAVSSGCQFMTADNTRPKLLIEGQPMGDLSLNGANYFFYPNTGALSSVKLSLEHNGVLPSQVFADALPITNALTMKFRSDALMSHRSYILGGQIDAARRDHGACVLSGEGLIKLPVPWPNVRGVVVELTGKLLTIEDSVEVRIPMTLSTRNEIDKVQHQFFGRQGYISQNYGLVFTGSPSDVLLSMDFSSEDQAAIRLDGIRIHPIYAASHSVFDIGSPDDAKIVRDGFYNRYTMKTGATIRWTAAVATAEAYLFRPASTSYILTIATMPAIRPANTPPPCPRITWNQVALMPLHTGSDNSDLYRFIIPVDSIKEGGNRLDLSVTPWVPYEITGAPDCRRLGIAIDKILVEPYDQAIFEAASSPQATP